MKGGINKIVRNIVATKGKSEIEKVYIIHILHYIEIDQSYLSSRL